jgi:MinD-like ATPase involved in chromosome partitioning or flagellar assembly
VSRDTSSPDVPRWPTITANVTAEGQGEVRLSPSSVQSVDAGDVDTARDQILALVAAHAGEHHGRAVRLQVVDPDGEWLLGVNPDGTGFVLDEDASDDEPPLPELGDPSGGRHIRVVARQHERDTTAAAAATEVTPEPRVGRAASSASVTARPVSRDGHGRSVDRVALHSRPPGPLSRLVSGINERLKDSEQREEEQLDQQFERRFLVTDTNLPVVVSPKGGPGKTTVALIVGDAMASRMANQRIAAIDFNPGGGALEAVATEDRAARLSMLQLHRDRAQVRSHAQLQPYVASLHSGLDLLAVPPDPGLALTISTQHYNELFDDVLLPSYNVLVLDTSPDITSPVTQLALQRGSQMIIVLEQGYVSSGVVLRSLRYLLSQPAAGGDGSRATVVINRVMSDPRAGSLQTLREEIAEAHAGPIVEIPWDLDLRADVDSGSYTLDRVKRRSTRLPLKRLALHVAENFQ